MKVSGTKAGGVSKSRGSQGASRASASSKKSGDKVDAVGSSSDTAPSDAVEVSDHVQTIEIIKGIVKNTPDIRVDEVERIAKKLQDGTYKIDYERVAEAFIREVILTEIARKPRKK